MFKNQILPIILLLSFVSCKLDKSYVKETRWKYGGGFHIGDILGFESDYFQIKNDTIYKQKKAVAILSEIETGHFGDDNEITIVSIENGEKGTYHDFGK